MMNFLNSPIQSPILLLQDVIPPIDMNDQTAKAIAGQPLATKRARIQAAHTYVNDIHSKIGNDEATSEDLIEARLYEIGLYIAELLPSIQRVARDKRPTSNPSFTATV